MENASTIKCGHSYCKKCIETQASIVKTCNVCGESFNDIYPNFNLRNLIDGHIEEENTYFKKSRMYHEKHIKNNNDLNYEYNDLDSKFFTIMKNSYKQYNNLYTILVDEKEKQLNKLYNDDEINIQEIVNDSSLLLKPHISLKSKFLIFICDL